MIYWKGLLFGCYRTGVWDGRWTKSGGETVSDEPDCVGSCLWCGEAEADPSTAPGRILKFSLMSCSSLQMARRPRQ